MPAEALRSALTALHDRPFDAAAKEDLHRHVCDYVDEAHAADWPPERMLIEVKKILRATGYRTSHIVSGKYREYRDTLVEEIVHLCIVEYFDRSD
jgi:hypothetical protein